MTVRLVDVENSPELTDAGTCELCFSTINVDNPVFVFRDDATGDTVRIDGYEWDYGDYMEVYVHNIVDFGSWVARQDGLDITDLNTTSDLNGLVYRYREYSYYKDH